MYFTWTPLAGDKTWSYPSVHILYWDENSTHIWREYSEPQLVNDCSILKSDVFPVVWRPFGQIWLPVSSSCLCLQI